PLLLAFISAVGIGLLVLALRWSILLDGLGCHVGILRLPPTRAARHRCVAVEHHVPAPLSIASVAADRTLELGANWMFAAVFATVLAQQGVPALRGALVTMAAAGIGLLIGIVLTVRRLRRNEGLLTAVAQGTSLDRFPLVQKRMQTLADAETALGALLP